MREIVNVQENTIEEEEWFEHLKRMRSDRTTKMILEWNVKSRKENLGNTWMDKVRRSTIRK